MSKLKLLKSQRSLAENTISRIQKFVDEFQNGMDNNSQNQLLTREKLLNDAFKNYQECHAEIMANDKNDEVDISRIEENYLNTLSKIKDYLDKSSFKVEPASNVAIAKQAINFETRAHLPHINISNFDGKDINLFKSFYDLFIALIHKNTTLSDVQKLYFLRGYLRHEALALISDLPLTNESYTESLQILEKRYNNPTIVINAHMKALLDTPNITKGNSQQLREFTTRIKQHLASLKTLNEPIDTWDTILVYIFSQKLDIYTNRAYQLDKNLDDKPNFEAFLEFLENRAKALEAVNDQSQNKTKPKVTNTAIKTNDNKSKNCQFCNFPKHHIFQCSKFIKSTLVDKLEFINKNKLCKNCLNSHSGECKLSSCKKCSKRHHTLLHKDEEPSNQIQNTAVVNQSSVDTHHLSTQVVIPTTKVRISTGTTSVVVKAILDSGSQASFITSEVVRLLKLKPSAKNFNIIGLSNKHIKVNQYVNIDISSCVYNFKTCIQCAVVPEITSKLPQVFFSKDELNIPQNILMADDDFNIPSKISLLLGADVFFKILLTGTIKLGNKKPVLQNTLLGYVVSGEAPCEESLLAQNNFSCISLHAKVDNHLENLVKQFWEQENIPDNSEAFQEDICENLFKNSIQHIHNRFQVKLPLKQSIEKLNLGDSFSMSFKRFLNLEKKFSKDNNLFRDYSKFISEYVHLGHAKIISSNVQQENIDLENSYFLPHHPVIKQDSVSTKLRVVFDGSMRTKNKISLNDMMHKGPTVQPELFEILLRFRLHKYVFVADIKQMYRQILLDPSHTMLQRILWRADKTLPLQCLELKTVTYGLKSSPFLATRCLVELANKYSQKYPVGSLVLLQNCYVDDILAGADTVNDALIMQKQLIQILSQASFELHKWGANHPKILETVSSENMYTRNIDLQEINSIKTLGLSYSTEQDCFSISCPQKDLKFSFTKRNILSFISKMYDPLGFCGPVITTGKIILQKLWKSQIGWDTIISGELELLWKKFAYELLSMNTISIPRYFELKIKAQVEIIGFCDASMNAYGACLYVRVIHNNNDVTTRLICSKSRVAPIKQVLTIPKLELNSCLLLTQVINKIYTIFEEYKPLFFLYSDSTIALSWINTNPLMLNNYVANRVVKIQQVTNSLGAQWLHVKSTENPADCISRGIDAQTLKKLNIWWQGPSFLNDHKFKHESSVNIINSFKIPEQRVLTQTNSLETINFENFSNINKLQRIVAYCYRFINNLRNPKRKIIGALTVAELKTALYSLLKAVQHAHFHNEFECVKQKKPIMTSIKSLTPFIDSGGLLRVGGRLQNASVAFAQKHPIILPSKDHVIKLIIQNEHSILLHAGHKMVSNNLRLRYWIVRGNREIKKIINKCVICHKYKTKISEQVMGSLPYDRVNQSSVFEKVGIDFGGPFYIKQSRVRRSLITKAYIAVFVCFTTKAMHIELISDMKTDTFLAALKRFVGRRGCPAVIYSDNGSTFKSANNHLNEIYKFFENKKNLEFVQTQLALKNIQWKYIPNYSPNFGGLWEAAIKSTKYHIKRVVGTANLTYEEMQTILIQIEAILNSRPLCQFSDDPTDFTYLTPAHFLLGKPVTSLPEQDISDIKLNRLSFWKQCSRIQQEFWKRWHKEYLSSLQNKPKWHRVRDNLKVGQLVLLKDGNPLTTRWSLARIVSVSPGKDGKVRVVEVKTPTGTTRVAISKLSPLPIEA